MDQQTWQDRFSNLEPDAFPDLTGLSPLAKQELRGNISAIHHFEIKHHELQDWSEKTGFSTGELLQAAWAKVLASYSGETDLCFGFGSQEVDCLPVRVAFETTSRNIDVLHELRRHSEACSRSELVGIDQISEYLAIQPKRLLHSSVVFNGASSSQEHNLLHKESDVLLEMFCSDTIIRGNFRARESLILQRDIPKVFSLFEIALRHLIYDPSLPFLSFSNPNFQFQEAVSNAGCQPSAHIISDNVHGLVEHNARRQPNAIALDFLHSSGDRTKLSFQELNSMADRVADTLVSQMGVQLEDSVPVCVPKSPEFYVCILGVMKAGASFTPFSNVPSKRKQFMLNELKAKVVLHTEDEDISWCHEVVKLNVSTLLRTGTEIEGIQGYISPRPSVKSSNVLYRMYTSGSTGRPKAVSLEHGNAMQTVMATRHMVPWRPESRMLQYATPSFDMCYYDTFLAWSLGICLCSASDRAVYNDLTTVINRLEANMMGLTPSVAITLDPEELPSIQWLYCIGEAMPQILVDKWQGRLVNSYGPTEAAQMVTLFQVDPNTKSAVIGRPFPNTSFYVMQKNAPTLVPILAIGELCIGGYQVARGYYANEEKTKTAFIEHDGIRMYKTGDLVRMLGDGTYEFIGRNDDQVKIRGQRVELGEIDQAIMKSRNEVSQVSTQILKVTDQASGQLVAFVSLHLEGSKLNPEGICKQIFNHLQTILPTYMVPRIILPIDKIPLSASGKVDRKVLTTLLRQNGGQYPDTGHLLQQSTGWSENEQIVRDAFATISEVEAHSISREVTIFQLGIDSIGAIKVASILKRKGLAFEASDIMAHPSVSELVKHIDHINHEGTQRHPTFDFSKFHRQNVDSAASQPHVKDSSIHAVRPCTALQSGMIAQTLQSDGAIYFNQLKYELIEEYDHNVLKSAWGLLVEKYEILRTGFLHTNDPRFPFAMVTYKPKSIEMPFHTSWDFENVSDNMTRFLNDQLAERLQMPPWKVVVQGRLMTLVAHHSLYDAQVLNLFIRDLALALQKARISKAVSIEPQLDLLLNSSTDEEHPSDKFWSGLKEYLIPTKFPILTPLKNEDDTLLQSSKRCSKSFSELEAGCKQNNITLQVAGQVAWARILSAYVGEEHVTFGTVLSGRNAEGSDEIGFPCITTIPTPVHAHQDKQNLLCELLKFNANAQKHQHTPLKRIEKMTGHSNEALFNSIFTLQKGYIDQDIERIIKFKDNQLAIDYPISVELEADRNGHFYLNLYHRLNRVPKQQAEIMLDQLDCILCDIVSDAFEFATPTINSADPKIYSKTPALEGAIPSEPSLLHHLFEVTAAKNGHKIALEYILNIAESNGRVERLSWTYKEVEAMGNRVANFLAKSGVRVGSIVAMCFDKCPEAAFTMLGISKAGCSFLALDPMAPQDRKQFILKDSKAVTLITKGNLIDDLLAKLNIPVTKMENVDLQAFDDSRPVLDRTIDAQDLSYCLYTSGTTGLPKGCAITHENAVQAMLSFQRLYKRTETSRWLQFASYHFDVSVMEYFWSWSVAMCVVTASRDLVFADLPGTIRKLNISHIDLTPSLARTLDPDELPDLANGVFVVGGEMLRQEILDKWGPTGAIHNAYGPTEATIGVTMYPGVPTNGRPANIGKQFDNVGSYVLDPKDSSKAVLRGAIGELCVSGKLVAQGYINRPELTAEKFVVIEGERCYRTGDLVRILYDGSFDFAGRVDDQVKLRGQRLEIGEINSIIRQSDVSITDVSTLVLKHPGQQKEQLVSFLSLRILQAKPNDPVRVLFEDTLSDFLRKARDFCELKLPPYMVPTHFLAINKMPLSTNNKADAKQLKALFANTSLSDLQRPDLQKSQAQGSVPSLQPDNQKITEAVSKTLGIPIERVSPTSSFFQLGLDSISIIGLTKTLRQSGIATSTAMVMRHPSVLRLSQALSSSQVGAESNVNGDIVATQQQIRAFQLRHKLSVMTQLGVASEDIEAFAMCTPLQQGMISRAVRNSDGVYFNQFKFTGIPSHSLPQLRRAFQTVVDHAPILRTRFVPTDEGYAQLALKDVKVPWEVLHAKIRPNDSDVESILNDQHRKWWERATESQILEPIAIFIHDGPKQADVSLSLFHACYDGRSLSRIIECLLHELQRKSNVNYGPNFYDILPYGPLQVLPSAKAFWEGFLKNVQFVKTKGLSPLSQIPSEKDFFKHRKVTDLHHLEICRRNLDVTHQAIFQTCWIAALQDSVGEPMVVGLVLSGSSIDFEGSDKTIGPIFNTVPFLPDLKPDDCWKDAVRRCHELNTRILPFQHTPLRDIQKWLKESGARLGDQLFESVFVYQRKPSETSSLQTPWKESTENIKPDFPLAFEVEQTDENSLSLTLACQKGYASPEKCDALFDRFLDCLEALLKDSESPVEDKVKIYRNINDQTHSSTELSPEISRCAKDVSGSPKDPLCNFEWDELSSSVRDEIAELAGLSPQEIDPDISILGLGLDSVDAVKLSSRLRSHLGLQMSVSRLMRALTIRNITNLASELNVKKERSGTSQPVNYRREKLLRYAAAQGEVDFEDVFPATPLQEGMIAEMISSNYTRYFNHDILELAPDTDVEQLEKAWNLVVDHTALLKSHLIQVSDPEIESAYAFVKRALVPNLWNHVHFDTDDEFDFLLEKIRKDFTDKTRSLHPLLQLTLVQDTRTAKSKHLILSISHALYDGWSIGLIHDSVRATYNRLDNATKLQQPSFEPVLNSIFSANDSSSDNYWRQVLHGITPSALSKRQASADGASTVHRLEVACDTSAYDIQLLCKKMQVTVSAFSQTIWSLALSSLLKGLDVAFGLVLSGRDTEEAQRLRFPTMNTVIARSILHGSIRNMLQDTQRSLTDLSRYQHFPLRKALNLARSQARGADPFNSLFIYQKKPEADQECDPEVYQSIGGFSDVEYPLCVEAEIDGTRMIWRLAGKDEYISLEESRKLLDNLKLLVQTALARPDQEILRFTGSKVQICELRAFEQHQSTQLNDTTQNQQVEEEHLRGNEGRWTSTESSIRQVITKVSGMRENEIGKQSSLLSLGLDSISAIKISSLLKEYNIQLAVNEVLRAGSITGIAKFAEQKAHKLGLVTSPDNQEHRDQLSDYYRGATYLPRLLDVERLLLGYGVDRQAVEVVLPATSGQVFMLSKWQNTGLYHSDIRVKISGVDKASQIEAAWDRLISQTAILRTVFIATGDTNVPIVQVVKKDIETGAFLSNSIEREMASTCLTFTSDNSELRAVCPARVVAEDLGHGYWALGIKLSHALFDGYSLHLLLQRFLSCFDENTQLPLSSPADYLSFTKDSLFSIKDTENFWKTYLSDLKLRSISRSKLPATQRTHLVDPFAVPNLLGFKSCARLQEVSMQSLFIAAYAVLYAQRVGADGDNDDVLIGVYTAARGFEGADVLEMPTLGFVPIRVKSPLRKSIPNLARSIQQDLGEISEGYRSSVGLWQLRQWLGSDFFVETWVNILQGSGSKRMLESTGDEKVCILYEESRDKKEDSSPTSKNDAGDRNWGLFLDKNPVRDEYQESLDIEATIYEDSIDIGIIVAENLLSPESARKILNDLSSSLNRIDQ